MLMDVAYTVLEDNCNILILSYSSDHINCNIYVHNCMWRFIGFYGNPDPTGRVQS